ncbi:MAG: serine/threonine protein kinase [Planctomycetes bacterium]|nr:serine/threonine protein kinase [Planctomycetota bacterium]
MSTEAHSSAAAPTPERIGPYRVLGELGEGGMGTVYLAEQREPIERRVAIKVVKLGMDTREVLTRFHAEQRALERMDHPGIAQILDAGLGPEGRPYFVMEHVPGAPITGFCDERALDVDARLRLCAKVCRAVHHAHERGVVHRDLKPTNVLVRDVDGEPQPKVIDFGIAKAIGGERLTEQTLQTELGRILGTPAYMSPEQADPRGGREVDRRADVFSLGTIVFEILVGAPPIDAATLKSKSFVEVQRLIAEVPLPTPSQRLTTGGRAAEEACRVRCTSVRALRRRLRDGVDHVVVKATEKRPELRYATALELAEDLERCASGAAPGARPRGPFPHLWLALRRHRRRIAAAAGAAVVLLAAALFLDHYLDAIAERDALREELQRLESDHGTLAALDELPRENGALLPPDEWQVAGGESGSKAALPDSLSVFARRLELNRSVYGDASPRTLDASSDLAGVMLMCGEAQRANGVLVQALERAESAPSVPVGELARLRNDLAVTLLALGREDEARAHWRSVVALAPGSDGAPAAVAPRGALESPVPPPLAAAREVPPDPALSPVEVRVQPPPAPPVAERGPPRRDRDLLELARRARAVVQRERR